MNDDIAIQVDHVSKTFKLPHEKNSSVKGALIGLVRGGKRTFEKQEVLKDVSFEIKKGEFFGIVGRNGSGKSTLLKMLAGIYTPTNGQIHINGKLTPFIELGVGFNPELTGRENVFLNGALLGFNRKDMEEMYDDIVEFAELERFMDQKLKNYSSGMQVRLAFSIAIRANSDILILDEVLAVGDEAFQRKCNEYFVSLKGSEKTVVLVTHDMEAVRRFCSRAILIDEGLLKIDGSPDSVASQYTIDNYATSDDSTKKQQKQKAGLSDLVPEFTLAAETKQALTSKDKFKFNIIYKITEDLPVRLGISVIDESAGASRAIFDDQPKDEKGNLLVISEAAGVHEIGYEIPLYRFNNRELKVTAELYKVVNGKNSLIAYASGDRALRFSIYGETHDGGLLKEKGSWIRQS